MVLFALDSLVSALKALISPTTSQETLRLRQLRWPVTPTHLYIEGHPLSRNYVLGPNSFNGLIHGLNETAGGDLMSKFVHDTEV